MFSLTKHFCFLISNIRRRKNRAITFYDQNTCVGTIVELKWEGISKKENQELFIF